MKHFRVYQDLWHEFSHSVSPVKCEVGVASVWDFRRPRQSLGGGHGAGKVTRPEWFCISTFLLYCSSVFIVLFQVWSTGAVRTRFQTSSLSPLSTKGFHTGPHRPTPRSSSCWAGVHQSHFWVSWGGGDVLVHTLPGGFVVSFNLCCWLLCDLCSVSVWRPFSMQDTT